MSIIYTTYTSHVNSIAKYICDLCIMQYFLQGALPVNEALLIGDMDAQHRASVVVKVRYYIQVLYCSLLTAD